MTSLFKAIEVTAPWYSAIVSTLALFISLYVALRDRPSLKVSVRANMRAQPNADNEFTEGAYTIVQITNTGRRTVAIATVWFSQKPSGNDIALDDSARVGPREVAEGRSTSYVLDQAYFPGMHLHRVFVRDEAGRIWTQRVPAEVRQAYAR
jgi:hypothetical protein